MNYYKKAKQEVVDTIKSDTIVFEKIQNGLIFRIKYNIKTEGIECFSCEPKKN